MSGTKKYIVIDRLKVIIRHSKQRQGPSTVSIMLMVLIDITTNATHNIKDKSCNLHLNKTVITAI